jgi:hypothetical protein
MAGWDGKLLGEICSGGLILALPWTLRKTPHFFVCIIGKAKQGHPGKQYGQPSHAENDPEHHELIRFTPVLRGWS